MGAFDAGVQAKVEAYAKTAKEENLDLKGVKMKELGWDAYHQQM